MVTQVVSKHLPNVEDSPKIPREPDSLISIIFHYVLLVPLSFCVGPTATIFSIFTGGRVKKINEAANSCSYISILLVPGIFKSIIFSINPNSFIPDECSLELRGENRFPRSYLKLSLLEGVFYSMAAKKIRNYGLSSAVLEDNFFKKHIVSRLSFVAFGVVAVAARIVDFTIGIFFAAASLLTLGRNNTTNEIAFRNLTILGLPGDMSLTLRRIVNPNQEDSSLQKYREIYF